MVVQSARNGNQKEQDRKPRFPKTIYYFKILE